MSDSEAKAEEHFKEYDMATVRIAAEDEIYYYAARAVRLWSFEQQNKQKKAGVSDRNVSLMLLLFYFLFEIVEFIGVKKFSKCYSESITDNLYCQQFWILTSAVKNSFNR